ncbi:hypothetical protein ACIBG7_15095 [Nonomuraea sp. NPDC050328]|uniref:hypothetical protein n=1 Tax=Nonomuraea sp. NPDC050328 TaxID=3364361 RepID=UPI0037B41F5D
MGWGSAGYRIFDPVARALLDANASEEITRRVLGKLIDELRQEDWDTETDSLDEFRDQPVIVAVFRDKDVTTRCRNTKSPLPTAGCTRLLGHGGDHRDDQDNSWSATP